MTHRRTPAGIVSLLGVVCLAALGAGTCSDFRDGPTRGGDGAEAGDDASAGSPGEGGGTSPCKDEDGDGFWTGPADCRGCPSYVPRCAPGDFDLTTPCDEDVDDANDSVHPFACEQCDGVDNDGDGLVDEEDPDYIAQSCPLQLGICVGAIAACGGTSGPLPCGPAEYRRISGAYSAEEVCDDGLDNNCNHEVDEGCPP